MTTNRPATASQKSYIRSLAAKHDVPAEHAARLEERLDGFDVKLASATIEWLKALPEVAAPPAAEAGFYVRDDQAYRVQWNKDQTRTYAKQFVVTGGKASWVYAPGVGRSLAAEGLTPMTAGDAARIGLSHGFCINCCRELGGKSLSAHVSALIGYGETCAKTNGWPYPTGAKAQRAFIAEAA
jgi:hypothetical protein